MFRQARHKFCLGSRILFINKNCILGRYFGPESAFLKMDQNSRNLTKWRDRNTLYYMFVTFITYVICMGLFTWCSTIGITIRRDLYSSKKSTEDTMYKYKRLLHHSILLLFHPLPRIQQQIKEIQKYFHHTSLQQFTKHSEQLQVFSSCSLFLCCSSSSFCMTNVIYCGSSSFIQLMLPSESIG